MSLLKGNKIQKYFVILASCACFSLFILSTHAFARKTNIAFPTASTTGALYPLGAGIASVWNDKIDDIRVRVQASNGGIQNLNLLKSKEAQVSFAVSSITYEALHGQRGFKGRAYEDVRVLAGLYYNPNQVIASNSSGVEHLIDFKDKTFATGAVGSTTEVESRVHFTALGLEYPQDIKAQFVGFTESVDLIRNKQIDGVWIMAGLPTAAVSEMTTTANAKLVSMSDELIADIQSTYPWYSSFTIPANTYANQAEPISTTAVKMLLLTDASMDDELVYEMTKTFWENLDIIGNSHAVAKSLTIDMAISDLSGIELHEGAKRYYKEIGLIVD